MNYQEYLCHFNANHDPRTGQFAKGHGVVSSTTRTRPTSTNSENRRSNGSGGLEARLARNGVGRTIKDNAKSFRGKTVLAIAGTAGLITAGVSAWYVHKYNKTLSALTGLKLDGPEVAKVMLKNAGKQAMQAGLATYGAFKFKDAAAAVHAARQNKTNGG